MNYAYYEFMNNTYCLNNRNQLIKSLNNAYDVTDSFNDINLNDLHNIINSLFQKYFTKLKLIKKNILVILKLLQIL